MYLFVGMLVFATVFCVAGTTLQKQQPKPMGPAVEWMKTFGSDQNDWGNCVAKTSDGGCIICGPYGRNVWSLWYSYLYLLKVDASGNEQWHQTLGTYTMDHIGRSVQQTSDGGYIIAGEQGAGWQYSAFIMKTDASGNMLWTRVIGNYDAYDTARCVKQTPDGGYIVAGMTQSFGAGGADAWLIKLDMNGNEQWNRTFGGPLFDAGNYVDLTTDTGYVIIGSTESYGTGGSADAWLIKTDSNGHEEWNKTFGGTDYEDAAQIQQTTDGGFVFVGTKPVTDGTTDIWVMKTDASGVTLWERTLGGTAYDTGYSIQQTTDGGYFVVGDYTNPMTMDPEVYAAKLDKNGNMKWNQTFDGNGSEDHGYFGIQTANHGYLITGSTGNMMDAASDVWLIKLAPEKEPAFTMVISGGLSASTKITNSGTADATNVPWSIQVRGGLFHRINTTVTGTIANLPVGDSTTVSTRMLFGFGNIKITSQADQATSTVDGTQLVIFTVVKK